MLGFAICKKTPPAAAAGHLRRVQASEPALWLISMVVHKVPNFTKTAVTDVNLQRTRERGVRHHSGRGFLCVLNVSHLLNDHARNYKISPQMMSYGDFTQKCPTLWSDQVARVNVGPSRVHAHVAIGMREGGAF